MAIDDEPRALAVIEKHAGRIDFLKLEGTFLDPLEATAFLQQNPVDLVLLDIQMPEISGLDLLRSFPRHTLVVFTTAHSEYAVASYEVDAVDYLLKPFDFARFLLAMTRVRERLKQNVKDERDFFFVTVGREKRRLTYTEIYYLEGEGNYVAYHTKDGKVLVRSSIRDALKKLPSDRFVQIHRSYLVALPWVEKVQDYHVHIAGRKLPIGATFREAFEQIIGG